VCAKRKRRKKEGGVKVEGRDQGRFFCSCETEGGVTVPLTPPLIRMMQKRQRWWMWSGWEGASLFGRHLEDFRARVKKEGEKHNIPYSGSHGQGNSPQPPPSTANPVRGLMDERACVSAEVVGCGAKAPLLTQLSLHKKREGKQGRARATH
jgi:hypothetical protein